MSPYDNSKRKLLLFQFCQMEKVNNLLLSKDLIWKLEVKYSMQWTILPLEFEEE